MKKLLCLLTLLLMCSVSFGATTETTNKRETKVLIMATVGTYEAVANAVFAMKNFGSVTLATREQFERQKEQLEVLKFEIGNYEEVWEYIPPLINDKSNYFYNAKDKPINNKSIGNKAKHFRKSRDAI